MLAICKLPRSIIPIDLFRTMALRFSCMFLHLGVSSNGELAVATAVACVFFRKIATDFLAHISLLANIFDHAEAWIL